jgi:Domain of unknown function (DUF4956)
VNISALVTEVIAKYSGFGIDLAIDVVAILLMAYVLYFRRHWRVDLLLSFITLNIGIFVVMSVLTMVKVDVATGFGLFAILSIIRLRSSAVTQQEVAYYFVALVMGLLNGMGVADRVLVVALNVLLLATMAVFDSKRLRDRSHRLDVQLKRVYQTDAALVDDLERQLGGRVIYHEVTEIDLGRQHTTVDVRYRPGVGVAQQDVAQQADIAQQADVVQQDVVQQDVVQQDVVEQQAEPVRPQPVVPAVEEIPVGAGERTEELVLTGARDSDENRSARTS